MPTVDELIVRIDADISRLKQEMRAAERTTATASGKMQRVFGGIGGSISAVTRRVATLKTALLGLGAAAALSRVVRTAANFERLEARMRSVTSSSEEASAAFNALVKFAVNTPNSLQQVTNAFIRLSSLGVRPTEEQLMGLANLGSGLGRNIEDVAAGVIGAVTGSTERLTEMGVVTRLIGDQVSFTFDGITTTVNKTGDAALKFIADLGNKKFGGAAAREMETLNGAFSNLGDTIDIASNRIGKAGLSEEIIKASTALRQFIETNPAAIQQIGQELAAAVRVAAEAFAFLTTHLREATALMAAFVAFRLTPGHPLLRLGVAAGAGATAFILLRTEMEKAESEARMLRREFMNLAGVTPNQAVTFNEFLTGIDSLESTFGDKAERARQLLIQIRDLDDKIRDMRAKAASGESVSALPPPPDPAVLKLREDTNKITTLVNALQKSTEGLGGPFAQVDRLIGGLTVTLANADPALQKTLENFEAIRGQNIAFSVNQSAAAIREETAAIQLAIAGKEHLIPLLKMENDIRRQFNRGLAESQRLQIEAALNEQKRARAQKIIADTTDDLEDQVAISKARVSGQEDLVPLLELELRLRRMGIQLNPLERERIANILSQKAALEDLEEILDDVGDAFASAFEKAIIDGERLSDVLAGLEQDLLRLLTRKMITEPIADMFTGFLSGAGGGNLLSGALGFLGAGSVGGAAAGVAGGPGVSVIAPGISFPHQFAHGTDGFLKVPGIGNKDSVPIMVRPGELLNVIPEHRAGSVTNNNQRTMAPVINISVTPPPGANRQSAQQFGDDVGRRVAAALARM